MAEKNHDPIKIALLAEFLPENLLFFCYDFGYDELKLYENCYHDLKHNPNKFINRLVTEAQQNPQHFLKLIASASKISSIKQNITRKSVETEHVHGLINEHYHFIEWFDLQQHFVKLSEAANNFNIAVGKLYIFNDKQSIIEKWLPCSKSLHETVEFTISTKYIDHSFCQIDNLKLNHQEIRQVVIGRNNRIGDEDKDRLSHSVQHLHHFCTEKRVIITHELKKSMQSIQQISQNMRGE